MAKSELTNQIRRLRFEAGQMTQEELADKVGVTRQTIIILVLYGRDKTSKGDIK